MSQYLQNILAKTVNVAVFPVNVPSFVLRAAFGEMSDVVLKGSMVSGEKIRNAGYEFVYPVLKNALRDLLSEK